MVRTAQITLLPFKRLHDH